LSTLSFYTLVEKSFCLLINIFNITATCDTKPPASDTTTKAPKTTTTATSNPQDCKKYTFQIS